MRSQGKCLALLAVCLLAVCLLALGAGCSGDDEDEAGDRKLARSAVLAKSDLPKSAKPGRWPFGQEECSPAEQFKTRTAAVADPPRYVLPATSFLHTVGVFDSDESSRSAVDDFFADENNECVLAAMRRHMLEQTGREARGRATPLAVGSSSVSEARGVRFAVATDAGDRVYFDTIGLRDGRALTVVGYYSRNAPVPDALKRRLTETAERRLASAMAGG